MTLVADQLASYILGDTVVCPEVLIDTYKDSFVQVCKVVEDSSGNWMYAEINEDVMFDTHTSWVYFIVDNGIIKKVGETGLQLGIRNSRRKSVKKCNLSLAQNVGLADIGVTAAPMNLLDQVCLLVQRQALLHCGHIDAKRC